MNQTINRRQAIVRAAATVGAVGAAMGMPVAVAQAAEPEKPTMKEPFGYCFNTSTIRGQKLPIVEQVDVAAEAGYQAIEPWVGDLDKYVQQGGSLEDLRKRIADAGLSVESGIAFGRWIVDDPAERKAGLEQCRRDMDTLARIGGKRIAAPPSGATDKPGLDLFRAAQRYRALLEVGDQAGIVPQVEVWGFSRNLSRLGETTFVAIESGHPKACILPDIYHIYKGGSDFVGLGLLSGTAVGVLHINDYPADPPRARISDADRVYPGDGVAPLGKILRAMHAAGFRGVLSLELFNPGYWKLDAATVARTGLAKTRAAVQQAFAS